MKSDDQASFRRLYAAREHKMLCKFLGNAFEEKKSRLGTLTYIRSQSEEPCRAANSVKEDPPTSQRHGYSAVPSSSLVVAAVAAERSR